MQTSRIITDVKVELIDEDENIRFYYDEETIDELAASVKQNGILQPLLLRRSKTEGRYHVVIGSRRRRAAIKAGHIFVPAILVENLTSLDALSMAFNENIQREDLTPFEEAWAIFKLMNDYELGTQDIAKRIGKSENFVRTRIQLLSLPEPVQNLISERKLRVAHASALARIPDPNEQIQLAETAAQHGLNLEELRLLVRQPDVLDKKYHAPISATNTDKSKKPNKTATIVPSKKGKVTKELAPMTAGKIIMKLNFLVNLIPMIIPQVVAMDGVDIINIKAALQKLTKVLQKAVEDIEEQCGKF